MIEETSIQCTSAWSSTSGTRSSANSATVEALRCGSAATNSMSTPRVSQKRHDPVTKLTLHRLEQYVAVKVCAVHLSEDGTHDHRPHWEWEAYSRLLRMRTEHEGLHSVRRLTGRFKLEGSMGAQHPCFVYKMACMNVFEMRKLWDDRTLHPEVTQDVLKAVLRALDFLHTEARIVHTDIKEDSIFWIDAGDCPQLYAKRCRKRKPIGRYDGDGKRIVYRSTAFTDLLKSEEISDSAGRPLLGDLGEAHILPGDVQAFPPRVIAPVQFRAPDNVLGLPWGFGVDIWSFGMLAFSLIFGRLLFNARDGEGKWSEAIHLAQMTALMGPPPVEYLLQSQYGGEYWDENGQWLERDGIKIDDMDMDLEDNIKASDPEAKAELLDFLHCIFKWQPEERLTAKALLEHPFLQSTTESDGDSGDENGVSEHNHEG